MLPPLYKFRAINDYTLDSLREGYLFFSNPTTFNDPFEYRVFNDCSRNPRARKNDIIKMLKVAKPLLSFDERRKEAAKLMVNEGFKAGMDEESYLREEDLRSTCLFCMSGNRENLLQWAHYADHHRGICVEINPNVDTILAESDPVIYTDEYPVIDAYSEYDRSHFEKIALTKSLEWKYENEYRAFHRKEREFYKYFVAPETFVSITFGARITPDNQNKVIAAIGEKLSHLLFYKASLADRRFALEFSPCEG